MRRKDRWKQISAWILASAMVFTSSPGAVYAESLDDTAVFADGTTEGAEEFESVPESETVQETEAASESETETEQESETVPETEAASESETVPETGVAGETVFLEESVIVDAEADVEESTETAAVSETVEEEIIVDVEEEEAAADLVFDDGTEGDSEEETKWVHEYVSLPLSGEYEDQMLTNQTVDISNTLTGWVYTEDYSEYKTYDNVPVEAFEITAVYQYDDNGDPKLLGEDNWSNVVCLEKTEDGWILKSGEFCGYADLQITYPSLLSEENVTYSGETDESENVTDPYRIYVNGYVDRLEYSWPDYTNYMVPGMSMEIPVTLVREEWTDDGNYSNDEVEDYYLTAELYDDENEGVDSTSRINASFGEGDAAKTLTITALASAQKGWATVTVISYVKNESGDYIEDSERNISVYIADENGYPNIVSTITVENIGVGETFDISAYGFEDRIYTTNNLEGEILSDVKIYIGDYDENCWTPVTDENGDAVTDADGNVTKLIRTSADWDTSIEILADRLNSETNEYKSYDSRWYDFSAIDYGNDDWLAGSHGTEDSSAEYDKHIFNDETSYTLTLNIENEYLEDKDYTVTWTVGTQAENGENDEFAELEEQSILTGEDRNTRTVDGEKLAEANVALSDDKKLEVKAEVQLNGYYVVEFRCGLYTEVSEHHYADCFEDEDLLLDDSFWIDDDQSCWVYDSTHPDGENVDFKVTNVAITDEDGKEAESDVISIELQDDRNWRVDALQWGEAYVTVSYLTVDGENQTKTIAVSVTADTYSLDYELSDDTDRMLPGNEKVVTLHLNHSWRYDDENQGSEEIKGYTLDFDAEEESDAYDTNLISAVIGTDEDGYKIVTVTAKSDGNYWGTNISLRAMIGEKQVAATAPYVEVTDQYVTVDSVENISLGQYLDVDSLGLKVMSYSGETNEETELEGIRFSIDEDDGYDVNCWEDVSGDDSGLVTKLKRTSTGWDTSVRIIAEQCDSEGNYTEIDSRWLDFGGIDYSFGFADGALREDGWTFIYNDEEGYVLSLDPESQNKYSDDEEVTYEWIPYIASDNGETDEDASALEAAYTVAEDGMSITIDGAALETAYNELGTTDEKWYGVRIVAKVNGLEAYSDWEDIRLWYSSYGYSTSEDILQNEWVNIDKNFSFYEESSRYPFGQDTAVTVTNVTVADVEYDEEGNPTILETSDVCEVQDKEDENAYWVAAKELGCAVATVTYTYDDDENAEEYTYQIWIWVNEYMTWIDYEYSDDTEDMLPGSEKQITVTRLWRRWVDSETGETQYESSENFELSLNGEYDTDLLSSVEVEGHVLTVTAREDVSWETYINLITTCTESGKEEWEDYAGLRVNVTNEYYYLDLTALDNILVGETLNLSELYRNGDIKLLHYVSGQEAETVEGVDFDLVSMDTNSFERTGGVTSGEDGEIRISSGGEDCILERISSDDTEIRIAALKVNENEEGSEVLSESTFYFDELDYSIAFTSDRWDDEYEYSTWVFPEETNYALGWETGDWESNATAVYEVGYRADNVNDDEEKFVAFDETFEYQFWTYDKDARTVTIDGEKLQEAENWLDENHSDCWLELRISVYGDDGIVADYACAGIRSRGSEYDYPTTSETILKNQGVTVEKNFSFYEQSPRYPFGQDAAVTVENVTVADVQYDEEGNEMILETSDVCEVQDQEDENVYWVAAKQLGCAVATVTYTYDDDENAEKYTYQIWIFVNKYITWMEYEYSDGTEDMLPGAEKQITVTGAWRSWVDEESGETQSESSDDFELSLSGANDEYVGYDEKLLSSVEIKDNVLTVKSRTDGGWETYIALTASCEDSEGNSWDAYDSPRVNVCDTYYMITAPEDPLTVLAEDSETTLYVRPAVGESLDLRDYGLQVTKYWRTEDGENESADVTYEDGISLYARFDEEEWNLESEEDFQPLTRLTAEGTSITIVAQYTDEDGNTSEVAEKWYGFGEVVDEHTWEETNTSATAVLRESTCTEEGLRLISCPDCGATKTEAIEKIEHSWNAGVVKTNPTCTEMGVTTYTCTVCGTVKEETDIPAAGHTAEAHATVAATCTETGTKAYWSCKTCGKLFSDEAMTTEIESPEVIPATGNHTWDEGTVTKEPTVEEVGEKTYTCTVCGTTKTEEIAKLTTTTTTEESTTATTETPTTATTEAPTTATTENPTTAMTETPTTATTETPTTATTKTPTTVTTEEPVLELNASGTLPLKTKQKLTKLKVVEMAEGDSVESWTSSNPNIVTVSGNADGTCKLTAGKKTGKATITIRLTSGLEKSITIKVQKTKVKTKKIVVSGVSSKLTLKKGKSKKLSVTLNPISSTDKITYKTSNKKVVTVSSKGVIKAKKKGTATITIKAGKKTKKIKVTVK